MLKQRFINRVNSDRADSNSVSMILWIVLTVVLVLTVGGIIFNAVRRKGTAVGECIDKSGSLFKTIGNGSSRSAITGAATDCSNS